MTFSIMASILLWILGPIFFGGAYYLLTNQQVKLF